MKFKTPKELRDFIYQHLGQNGIDVYDDIVLLLESKRIKKPEMFILNWWNNKNPKDDKIPSPVDYSAPFSLFVLLYREMKKKTKF